VTKFVSQRGVIHKTINKRTGDGFVAEVAKKPVNARTRVARFSEKSGKFLKFEHFSDFFRILNYFRSQLC
jgi:hypothetical protein